MSEVREKPKSYIEWVQTQPRSVTSETDLISLYSSYVREFYSDKGVAKVDAKQYVVNSYIELLKDITINYTTIEERRFLSNIDFNNKREIDVILPFFVKKLKNITQYLVKKRQDLTFASVTHKFKGSERGVHDIVKSVVVDLISDTDFVEQYPTSFIPTLSSLASNITVDIMPLYDLYQNYFDVDADLDKDIYVNEENTDLYKFFTANKEQTDPFTWIDIDEAVNQLFQEIPELLIINSDNDTLASSSNLPIATNVEKSTNDLEDLPQRYFTSTKKDSDTIVVEAQKQLVEKFAGTDFYYLSTGSTITEYTSGVLYKAKNPVANMLNRYFASHAIVSNSINLKSEKNIGLFFTPSKQGLLNYHSPDFYYDFDSDNLIPNSVYIFPDPAKYATGRGNSKVDQFPVYDHYDVLENVKGTRINQTREGEIVEDHNMQKFYPYQSKEETKNSNTAGISKSTDNFDFWTGDDKDIWANSDVYPQLPLQSPPFDDKIQDLLLTDDIVYEWKTDIFGNSYALFKNTKPLRKRSEQITGNLTETATQDASTDVNSSLYNTATGRFEPPVKPYYNFQTNRSTTAYTSRTDGLSSAKTPYDRQNTVKGRFYFRNLYSTQIDSASSALSAVFAKYQSNSDILSEINGDIKNFDIIKDVIILETDNYLILEQFNYDIIEQKFTSVLPYQVMLSLSGGKADLEKFGNIYYDESKGDIYLTKTVLHPFLSGSNYKIIYPNILKFNINTTKHTELFSLRTLLGSASSNNIDEHKSTYEFLSSNGFVYRDIHTKVDTASAQYINISSIDKPLVSINDNDHTFTINYFAHDPNCNLYLFNQYYSIKNDNEIAIKKLDLFKPSNSIFNYNIESYFGNDGTIAPVLSTLIEEDIDRGQATEFRVINYDSTKSEVAVDSNYDMAFNCSLSGRKNTPTRIYDTDNHTIRLGTGVSATNEDLPVEGSETAPYSHNSSFLLFNSSLSGAQDDITVCFDFAIYTNTQENSGYAQINHFGT